MIMADFYAKNPRPFAMWPDIDVDFKDFIVRIMSMDPVRRLTVKEALVLVWFADVPYY
jgi:hypothetical protein